MESCLRFFGHVFWRPVLISLLSFSYSSLFPSPQFLPLSPDICLPLKLSLSPKFLYFPSGVLKTVRLSLPLNLSLSKVLSLSLGSSPSLSLYYSLHNPPSLSLDGHLSIHLPIPLSIHIVPYTSPLYLRKKSLHFYQPSLPFHVYGTNFQAEMS